LYLVLFSPSIEARFDDNSPLNVGVDFLVRIFNHCMRHKLMCLNFFIAVQELVGVFPLQVLWKE